MICHSEPNFRKTKMTKIKQIQSILERRIRHGDYILTGLPAERELSREVGASRMTARKAIERLMEKGLLERQSNGRLTIRRDVSERSLTFGFLVPSTSSGNIERWRLAIETAAQDANAQVRTILYVHWDDPMLLEAIENFDSVFLFPSGEEIPGRIIDRLKEAGRSLAVLERDFTTHSIASVCLFPPFFTQRLLDKLGELGHQGVDCFNVQTIDPIITSRIEQWNLWRAPHRINGHFHGEPVQPYTPYEAQLTWAYDNMCKILDKNKLKSTSLFCTTAIAAIGAIRAMRNRGIKVGEDISVCTINDEGLARYLSPSLTCIEMPDPTPYIRMCIERMQSNDNEWVGSLLIQPSQPQLFIGESTGTAKAATV
jgi:DNA-binding LacI/PurR family transcriptional regulator